MGITIRDVAREAGVSATTVSRVFNHGELVTDETRERVRAVAHKMGYRPNVTAQSLSHGRTQTIGVILPAPHGEFFSEIIRGIDEVAQDSDYYMLISSAHYSLADSEAALDALRGRTDGLLVMTTHVETQALLRSASLEVPVVFMNTAVESDRFDVFQIDNREGARMATAHLVEQGFERIGVITGPTDSYDVRERVAGYREALAAGGMDPEAQPTVIGDFTQASGYAAGKKILTMDAPPDAVFACNDYMAIGAMAALQEAGWKVPGDVALAGFDDIPSARYASPSLTTVRVPVHDLGRWAAERLIEVLTAADRPDPYVRNMPAELVVRASSQRSGG